MARKTKYVRLVVSIVLELKEETETIPDRLNVKLDELAEAVYYTAACDESITTGFIGPNRLDIGLYYPRVTNNLPEGVAPIRPRRVEARRRVKS